MMIGIVGHGVVGAALASWFASQGRAVFAYDPPKGVGTLLSLNTCDIVFVCVPTPYIAGRGVDQRAVLEAVGALDGSKLVVIKSTVLPGTTAGLQQAYPQHRFAFNPEFLREAHAQDDMTHPDRQILGVTLQSADDADRLLAMLPPAGFSRVCLAAEAEMAKYGANAFLAVKVSFSNDLFEVCGRAGIEYEPVRDIVAADAPLGMTSATNAGSGVRGCSTTGSTSVRPVSAASNGLKVPAERS